MKNKEQIQKYFNKKYFNKEQNYKSILRRATKEEFDMRKKYILNVAVILTVALIGTVSIAFTGNKIYNEFIKNKSESEVDSIDIKDDLKNNMNYDEETNYYYKIINNIDEYNDFKNMENKIPEMSEVDFSNNSLIVILQANFRELHEVDLFINDVIVENDTTFITLKQKDTPDYDSKENLICAIVDKNVIKNNIKIKVDFSNIIDSVEDYTLEKAFADGCFVIKDKDDMLGVAEVLSKGNYDIDEFVENSKNGDSKSIKIYRYSDYTHESWLSELTYEKGIFKLKTINLNTGEVEYASGRNCLKINGVAENSICYVVTNSESVPLVENGSHYLFGAYCIVVD